MSILLTSDFTGRYAVTQHQTNITKLQGYIDRIENEVMNKLLGVDLLALYVAGIEAEDEIYTNLLNPFAYNRECDNKLVQSLGIKEMLLGITYFTYQTENYSMPTANGNVVPKGEVSERSNAIDASLYTIYNSSVKTFKAIQEYICDNIGDYPAFKGNEMKLLNHF